MKKRTQSTGTAIVLMVGPILLSELDPSTAADPTEAEGQVGKTIHSGF
jgi:hypothetical protein